MASGSLPLALCASTKTLQYSSTASSQSFIFVLYASTIGDCPTGVFAPKRVQDSSEIKRGVVLEATENGVYDEPMRFGHQGWAEGDFTLTPTEMANGQILLDGGGRALVVIPHTADRANDRKLELKLNSVMMNGVRGPDDPSEAEAESLLRTKFRYTDAKIRKLKEVRSRRSW